MTVENLKMSDTTIAHIARLLQLAILTGTDIMDHLRSIQLVNVGGTLHLNPDYSEKFENELSRMQNELPSETSKVKDFTLSD